MPDPIIAREFRPIPSAVYTGGAKRMPFRSGARFQFGNHFDKETVPAGRPCSGSVFPSLDLLGFVPLW